MWHPEETAALWAGIGRSEGVASSPGDVALSASSRPTLLFQGDLQEEVETEVGVLGEEGSVG